MLKGVAAGVVIYVVFLCVLYWVLVEPDAERRHLQWLLMRTRYYQRIAETFGAAGIATELEYQSRVEKMRG